MRAVGKEKIRTQFRALRLFSGRFYIVEESDPVVTTDAAANETVVSRKRMWLCPSYGVHVAGWE